MWNKNTLSTAIFLTVYICIMPQVTEAYIDPGTGSLIVQAVLATIFGASFAIKVYWNKLKSFLGFRSPEQPKDGEKESPEQADNAQEKDRVG
ncbi:hypothetical protein A3F27_01615 [Candidatus Kaiserbacteria bacterium RIFCSPHIGHO2_12_FULL_53_13]|uniref:Uncharacterized protein n=1 Tax=Candidatus Kaiserbacteria bacterium RIFCSPHIGHO2_12_FULL_53_13 TaxID=1798502 RepID=A0A1F6E7Q3_9BACT|nr:MAG: hypothetical protein A3F27_01615 [Candidatus Kaiserbacteria bacterium RIFCSPHIGHO2_12_FULL_53_13]OGG74749.1 MAG: hypothetical protein A3A37_01360 [Candidatus Kaiserbacteria bacterium RIFCSPLOWO2_01_FULL_52_36]